MLGVKNQYLVAIPMGAEIERAASAMEALYRSGAISDKATNALARIDGVTEQLARGLGETSHGDELVLALILVDDSSSVSGNVGEIRSGHQLMLDALRAERFDADVQVQTRALNRGVISPYTSLTRAVALTENNYSANSTVTPLYLQSLLTLGTAVVKAQEEEARGVKVRTFTLVITDGADNRSGSISVDDVRALVTDMLDFSTSHIIAGMGIGEETNFENIFLPMGIPKRWIFEPRSDIGKLRAMFQQIAKSLAIAASSETAFLQLAPGPPAG